MPVGLQHQVVGHLARGLQVFLQQRRRHRQRLAGVVEAGRVGGIDRELARGPDVDAGQVANRVVVFGVAQPPGQHDAGIAGIACAPRAWRTSSIHAITHVGAPRARLPRLRRRHLLRPRASRAPAPSARDRARHRPMRRVRPQIELRRRRGAAVARQRNSSRRTGGPSLGETRRVVESALSRSRGALSRQARAPARTVSVDQEHDTNATTIAKSSRHRSYSGTAAARSRADIAARPSRCARRWISRNVCVTLCALRNSENCFDALNAPSSVPQPTHSRLQLRVRRVGMRRSACA